MKQPNIDVFDFTPNGVKVLIEIDDPSRFLLIFKSTELVEPPFQNTSMVSEIISRLLRKHFSEKHERFENKNIFIVEKHLLSPFLVLKCFEFNVEVFENGEFYVHFLPVSKIVSDTQPIDQEYLRKLKGKKYPEKEPEDLPFFLVNQTKFFREKLDLLDPQFWTKAEQILANGEEISASFDYHFLANYDSGLFGKITEDTKKELESSAKFINKILKEVSLPAQFNLGTGTFLKAEKRSKSLSKNLRVGSITEPIQILKTNNTQYGLRIEFLLENDGELQIGFLKNLSSVAEEQIRNSNKPLKGKGSFYEKDGKLKISRFFFEHENPFCLVEKQSQSFYTGIYKPAWKGTILPILMNPDDLSQFRDLIKRFNPLPENFRVLPEILIQERKEDPRTTSQLLKEAVSLYEKENKRKFIVAIFTKYKQPTDTFHALKNISYQLYHGRASEKSEQSKLTLSNFVCKCLEKLGGQIAAIDNTFLEENGIFLGIDLGHTTHGEERKSNLAGVTFDNHGNLIGKSVVKGLSRKENLTKEGLDQLIRDLKNKMANKLPENLTHVVIHRDGKLHSEDLELLKASIFEHWNPCKLDVVEIIKSGYPIIVERNEQNELKTPPSGSFFMDQANRYAILITNDQVKEKGQTINPIIIKHKLGALDFNTIVEQVYWFTRVHTQGIHNPTRLPATTLKANNIVGTSKKTHRATYLG